MTQTTRIERYTTNACMDREDAEAMSVHLQAIESAMGNGGTVLELAGRDHETGLHLARLVRIMQRATQPDVLGQAACHGVSRIVHQIENGVRTFTVSTANADITINATTRTVSLKAPTGQVVQLDQFERRRRQA